MSQTNKPSEQLVKFANELKERAMIEPIELLPAEPDTLTECIEVTFFQRYLRKKKVSEKTKKIRQWLVKEKAKKPIESSYNKEFNFYEEFEEIEQPVIIKDEKTGQETYKFKMGYASNFVEHENFPFGNQWKFKTYFKKDEADKLNFIIGRAVAKLREELQLTNAKGLNKSQPVYIAFPVVEGLVISNFQLYGVRNKQAGLKGLNMTEKGKESEFARATIEQLKIVVERMKGKEMEVSKDWKDLAMQFPDLKSLKRKTA